MLKIHPVCQGIPDIILGWFIIRRHLAGRKKPDFNGIAHEVGPASKFEFLGNTCTVCLNGFDREAETVSHLLVRVALRHQFEHLPFPLAQNIFWIALARLIRRGFVDHDVLNGIARQ